MKPETALDTARELRLVEGPSTRVRFHGLSMEPLLHEADEVEVERVSSEQIEIGDILTYRYLDRYPTRRLVKRRGDQLTLWCDNWPERLFFATTGDLLGRVVSRSRDGRRLAATDPEWREHARRALATYRRWHGLWARLRRAPTSLRRRLTAGSA